tara:strand:- start:714 stop:1454 length:741 start_codon:yes stop_codon:yes gene_type:complete
MTKIYEKVSENFLELASLQRLNILFKLLERSRKRIEPLAKELDATKQEVHRNLVRLEQTGLITKDREGKYSLTTFGQTMCVEIPSILFLSQHKDYFSDHNFGDIPIKFIMRAGQLATGSYIKGVTKTLEKWKSVYKNANEYIYEILSEIPADLFDPIVMKIKTGIKYQYIVSESAIVPDGRREMLKKSGFYGLMEKGLIERKMKKSVQIVTILNEKEACVFFPNNNGEADSPKCFTVIMICFMNGV